MRQRTAGRELPAAQPRLLGSPGAGFDQARGNAAGNESMPAPDLEPMGILGLVMAQCEGEGGVGPDDAGSGPEAGLGGAGGGGGLVPVAGATGAPAAAGQNEKGFQPPSMGSGKGEKGYIGRAKLKSSQSRGYEVGGKLGKGTSYDGFSAGFSTTEHSGDTVTTRTKAYNNGYDNFGGTFSDTKATQNKDGKVVNRKEQRHKFLDGSTTDSDVLATTGKGNAPKVNQNREKTNKKGGIEDARLKGKSLRAAEAKDAVDEAGVDKHHEKGTVGKVMNHLHAGSVGDETGIDLESFTQERENEVSFASATSNVESIEGGNKATAQAHAGVKASGSALAEGRDVDAFGNERVSRAGVTGEGFAGGQVDASATHRRTKSGAEVSAQTGAKLGVGGEGAAGLTSQTKLADNLTAEAGAQVKGAGFAGVKGSATATASHGKVNAKVGGSADAMIGAEASGSVGAKAGIDGAGFDLAAVRGDAEGTALVGAEAKASGEVSADLIKGMGAKGSVSGVAGAKASGIATAGASLGGIDADGVAEGEALAGAEASANGQVSAGLLGVGASGGAEAFAGAMAGGEARFEVGAGGLNFAMIGVSGEVSAGIGGNASGKLSLSLNDVGVAGRAGATCGVGAGMGGLLSVDPSFPVRLPLEKLAENKVIPTADIGDLVGSAANLVFKPKGSADTAGSTKKKHDPTLPTSDVGSPSADVAAPMADVQGPMADVQGPIADMGPPSVDLGDAGEDHEQEGPPAQMTYDALMVEASPEQREVLQQTQAVIQAKMNETAPAVLGQMTGILSAGGGLYGGFMSLLGSAFKASDDAKAAALEGVSQVMSTGMERVAGIHSTLIQLGGSAITQITDLVTADPLSLATGGWEATIDGAVSRVHASCDTAIAAVQAVIREIKDAIAQLVKAALAAALSPIRSVVGSLAGVVGGFTGHVGAAGAAMIGGLRGALEPVEEGVEVEGMGGVLALPVAVSPTLATVEGPVGEIGTFGKDAISEGLNGAIDFISNGLANVLGVETGGFFGLLETMTSGLATGVLSVPKMLATGAGETAKFLIRPIVSTFNAIRSAGSWFLSLFGW